MKKEHLLHMVYLSATVFYLAAPANAMNEHASSPVQLPYPQMVSDKAAVFHEKQTGEDNSLFDSATGMSDEAWLFCSAMLALAGIFIVHKAAK